MSPASWISAQNLLAQIIGIALFAVQAPLLGPRAFGLMALVMVFIGFCDTVLQIAATDALISVRNIEDEHYATMTTASAAFAAAIGIGVFVFAHSIAMLFNEPNLEAMLRWMALLPLVSVLASAPSAASRRELNFRPLVIRELASMMVGGIVGMTLALLHCGVRALVVQTIVQRVLNVSILWRLVAVPFRLGFSAAHFREMWRYAGPMMLSQMMSWSAVQIPRFLLGLYLGATDLGIFSLASRFNDIVVQLTVAPAYVVARIRMREFIMDRSGFDSAVRRLLQQMAFLCFPLCIGGAVAMPVLIGAWLDPRWASGVVASQLMFLGAMPYVSHYALSAALLATNKQSQIAVNSTFQSITTAAVIPIFAPLGLTAATAAIALRPLASASIPALLVRRHCGISIKMVLRAQAPIVGAAMLMGVVVWLLRNLLVSHISGALLLPLLIAAGASSYAVFVRYLAPDIASAFVNRFSGH
jgi:O-antigen/teichoic acid export membrane protein